MTIRFRNNELINGINFPQKNFKTFINIDNRDESRHVPFISQSCFNIYTIYYLQGERNIITDKNSCDLIKIIWEQYNNLNEIIGEEIECAMMTTIHDHD